MNVVTVWWESDDYPREYVTALESQIPGLIVLSTHRDYLPLLSPDRYIGWWSKLEVFRPENRSIRPCLVVDLDTFVFDIEPFRKLDSDGLWLIREFLGKQHDGQSGMFIAPKDGISHEIWKAAEAMREIDFHNPYGDGGFLRKFPFRFIPDEVDGVLSYKAHKLQDSRPESARVVCFHGQPKPHNATGWANEYWKAHANAGLRN